MLEIGSLVDGKYRILDEVGRGGMSIVYLARNIRTNKQWAIKEVRKDGTNDFDIVRSNLIAETDILKKLDHPNLPNIIDILDDGDSFIIIMDFIEGNSLQHYLKHSGPQAEEDVVQWSIQLCDVLGYLHSRTPPIIYRDMKPANVMLKPDGNISLIDFGTAREYKVTSLEDTTSLGTHGYAAPEQYGGLGQTDARTDIYCLGATMHHLLTGDNPAEHPLVLDLIRNFNPNLSQGMEEIIKKCTQQRPEDRYQSCEELMYALNTREMLDESVIRQQKTSLALFFSSLFLTLLCLVGFLGFGAAEKKALQQTYDVKVQSAEVHMGQGEFDRATSEYEWAVSHDPGQAYAYQSLLAQLVSDGLFSSGDATQIQNLLRGSSESQNTNESVFASTDPEAYAVFCSQLGQSYMLMMESGGYSNAQSYLKTAKESQYISGSEKSIVETLYDMCVLYSLKDADKQVTITVSGSENEQKTFDEYWAGMYELGMRDDIGDVFNFPTMTQAYYSFVVARITDTTKKFVDAGVDPTEMLTLIDRAEQQLTAMGIADAGIDYDGARARVAAIQNTIG